MKMRIKNSWFSEPRTGRTHVGTVLTEGVKLRPNGSFRATRFLIPNHPFQYVRGESPHWGTAPAGTEGKAPGTAVANLGGTA